MSASASSKPVTVVLAAIYQLIIGVFALCGALGLLGLGALGGIVGTAASQAGDLGAEEQAIVAAAGAATAGLSILGILYLGLAIALLAIAVGLFMSKPWSYMGTIVMCAIHIGLTLIGAVLFGQGIGILQIVFMALSAVIIYLFLTSADIKRSLGQAV